MGVFRVALNYKFKGVFYKKKYEINNAMTNKA